MLSLETVGRQAMKRWLEDDPQTKEKMVVQSWTTPGFNSDLVRRAYCPAGLLNFASSIVTLCFTSVSLITNVI